MGVAVAFSAACFHGRALEVRPGTGRAALRSLGYKPELVQITPMETFNIIWVKLPILCAIFLASPWILYQVWAFISPGPVPARAATGPLRSYLFRGTFHRRWHVRLLRGISLRPDVPAWASGRGKGVDPMVSITEYFDLFVNVNSGRRPGLRNADPDLSS